MADRDSVETHLMIIKTWASFALKKDINFFEPAHFRDVVRWVGDALELLKAQEAVKPKSIDYVWHCGNCNEFLSSIESHRIHFCSNCGKAVKWE